MLQDECIYAIFDVDGTLVKGNCSLIFIDFLLASNVITPHSISVYRHLIKEYKAVRENHVRIAEEAFSVLSKINTAQLLKSWEVCFNEKIVPRLNQGLVQRVRFYQNQNIPVFLASGSPKNLIKSIAAYLHIPDSNIIASSLANLHGAASCNGKQQYCIGKGKEAAIFSCFKKRNISIEEACFYTDNMTDIPLLKRVKVGYWAGQDHIYDKFKLADYGIKRISCATKKQIPERGSGNILDDYYERHQEVIDGAITSIFPIKCQQNVLDTFVGTRYNSWDLETMQKAFFDPINKYLSTSDRRLLTMGASIFLQAGGVEPKEHYPLLGIVELLNISNEVFVDITNWTSIDTQHECDRSHLEISILGNASISLLSLPVHNIIQDRLRLSLEAKLRIYEMYTSIVYKSLLGNGIRLYWQDQTENAISFNEYIHVSKLLNSGLFQFGINLLQILKNTEFDQATSTAFSMYIQNAAVLVQLMRDDLSFKRWSEGAYPTRKYSFNKNTNLIGIHAHSMLKRWNAASDKANRDNLIAMIKEAYSVAFLNNQMEEYRIKVLNNIDAMPFGDEYKKLIESYTLELVYL